jgi:hypothetical protein
MFTEMPGLSPEANAIARYEAEASARSNALVNQKNRILVMLHSADNADDLEKVVSLLHFAAELWEADGYAYKVKELRGLVRERAERLLRAEEQYLSGLRKNDKTRRSTEASVSRLTILAGR